MWGVGGGNVLSYCARMGQMYAKYLVVGGDSQYRAAVLVFCVGGWGGSAVGMTRTGIG